MTDDSNSSPAEGIWWRLLWIVLFASLDSVAESVIWAIVVFQFGFVLFTKQKNTRLLDLGASISRYIYDVLRYITFNSDERPYPFGDWPADT